MLVPIAIAILFYWLRLRHRLLYAVAEILFALGLTVVAWFPAERHEMLAEESSTWDHTVAWVSQKTTLFGAIYVFVRGLDNLDVGLQPFLPTWRDRWRWLHDAVLRRAYSRDRLNLYYGKFLEVFLKSSRSHGGRRAGHRAVTLRQHWRFPVPVVAAAGSFR
jgi:hypothetical protein